MNLTKTMNETYDKIINAVSNYNFTTLKQIKNSLLQEMDTLDRFFKDFLENNTLDRKTNNTSNWSVYKDKTIEYCEVTDNLKIVNYYLDKYHV